MISSDIIISNGHSKVCNSPSSGSLKSKEKQRERQQSAAEDAAALLAKTELLHEELLDSWQKQRQQSDEVNKKR